MGRQSTNDDGPDKFERLIEALRPTLKFEGVLTSEEASGEDDPSSDVESQGDQNEVFDHIFPRSFEELRKRLLSTGSTPSRRRLVETVMPYLIGALCILGITGAIVFVITSSIAVLSVILTFFLVLFLRIFRGG